ncbi:pentapeptide repeat-containing protein [Cyanobium sp. Cruz CV13-4-11]|jgi:hypothetical protein|nr:pentapeptide repeat-containing protein [Cyanobium sp. Cruz CV11-17]MCP9918463.1 pentapeptide repeat-containing protein [Cyanobium sp. Cruz CV13-4-11]
MGGRLGLGLMSVSNGRLGVVEPAKPLSGRIPPWRWSLWGPWPPGASQRKPPPADDAIRARAEQLAQRRPWCTDEQNWVDASLELNSPFLLRWRPRLLRCLGASEKTCWDWMDLSLRLSIPVTISILGVVLPWLNNKHQNQFAENNKKDSVLREYIRDMQGILLKKEVAEEVTVIGSEENSLARALAVTALVQLRGERQERRDLLFQFLRESNLPILGGNEMHQGTNLSFADLRQTNLKSTGLRGTDIRKADLSGAYLHEADLRGANLSGADLSGADLYEVKWDQKTKWPDKSAFEGARNIPRKLKKQLGLD